MSFSVKYHQIKKLYQFLQGGNQWSCKVCTFENTKNLYTCEACASKREDGLLDPTKLELSREVEREGESKIHLNESKSIVNKETDISLENFLKSQFNFLTSNRDKKIKFVSDALYNMSGKKSIPYLIEVVGDGSCFFSCINEYLRRMNIFIPDLKENLSKVNKKVIEKKLKDLGLTYSDKNAIKCGFEINFDSNAILYEPLLTPLSQILNRNILTVSVKIEADFNKSTTYLTTSEIKYGRESIYLLNNGGHIYLVLYDEKKS